MGSISVLGMGFCCVDVIKEAQMTEYGVGGTAANVMCGLSYLGVRAVLLLPHYDDIYADYLERSIAECGVSMIHAGAIRRVAPKVIEQLNGGKHAFKTTCPLCGTNLNSTVLPTEREIERLRIEPILKDQNALFYDRISGGIKRCMKIAKANNVWTYYEPNSSRRYDTLLRNASSSSVVKFSRDSISASYAERLKEDLSCGEADTCILIVTGGDTGARFSVKRNGTFGSWIHVPGERLQEPFDTAGAGDWFTAGFLSVFLRKFPSVRANVDADELLPMICYAQKVAALSCGYKGAQGLLYSEAASEEMRKLTGIDLKHRKRVAVPEGKKPFCGYCGSPMGT